MKLVTFSTKDKREIGLLVGNRVIDLYAAADASGVSLDPVDDLGALARNANIPKLESIAAQVRSQTDAAWAHEIQNVTLHAPYRPRQNIMIAGGNTRDDFVTERSKGGRVLLRYHTKAPSATLDPGESISWPAQLTSQVQAEPSLAVIVGEQMSYCETSDVLDKVFGYAVATNVTSADLKRKHGQWDKAVSLDSFFPWGPVIATPDELDLDSLTCRLWLNEQMSLSGSIASGLLSTAEILSQISFGMTLEPGDVVLTCTAEGVGQGQRPERWLQDGDVVKSAIAEIGEIENPVAPY